MNVSKSAASVELDVDSMAGTFASSSSDNSATFSVATNNFSGYTLTISGNDDEGKLYDSAKQNFLSSLSSATTETDFSATSQTDLNGKWGYKPSKFNSAVNEDYLPAPTTTAATIDTTAAANTTANDYSISLGIRADYTTLADTYTNTFTIIAVPNPIAYVITYDANTTDTVSNMPAAQNSTTSATSITLSDKTPIRENYDFKGWCTVAPATTNPDTCTGTTFQPGDTYGIDQASENITTLYAMWEEQIAGYIQDYTYVQCETNAQNHAVKVIDKRDDKVYTVRYINGLCTMTQNLNFELTSGMILSPATTNVKTTKTLGTIGSLTTNGNTGSYTRARTAKTTDTAIVNPGLHYNYCAATAEEICADSTTGSTAEATEDVCPAGWRLPTHDEQTSITGTTQGSYSTANVTAFSAVAAGNYSSGSLNFSGTRGYWWSSTASSATGRYNLYYYTSDGLYSDSRLNRYFGFSVRCVKAKPGVTISFDANGGAGAMDMQKIDAEQSANLAANTFTRTDYVFTGWNTKADGTGTSYADAALYAAPASEDNKIVVLYAQWVPTMQSFTIDQCQSLATDTPIILGDVRDNQTYTARYINGLCTMTQNLNFNMTSGMTLSPDTTNVTTDRTIATVGSLLTDGDSYDEPRIERNSAVTGAGLHYNYAAATAGTITGSSNNTPATEDVCPAGWRLPTYDEQNLLTDGKINSYVTTYATAFSPVAAGNYGGGSLVNSGTHGLWWSSTAYSTASRDHLVYYGTRKGLYLGSSVFRYLGLSVRCVLGS